MLKRVLALTLVALSLSAVHASAGNGKWKRIGNGPSFAYADAECRMEARNQDHGMYASGSVGFVVGAQVGNLIANAARRDAYYNDCMTLQGWKRIGGGKGKAQQQQSR